MSFLHQVFVCHQGSSINAVWLDSTDAPDTQVCVQLLDQVETGEVVVKEDDREVTVLWFWIMLSPLWLPEVAPAPRHLGQH